MNKDIHMLVPDKFNILMKNGQCFALHCTSVYEKIQIYLDTNLKTILKEQE